MVIKKRLLSTNSNLILKNFIEASINPKSRKRDIKIGEIFESLFSQRKIINKIVVRLRMSVNWGFSLQKIIESRTGMASESLPIVTVEARPSFFSDMLKITKETKNPAPTRTPKTIISRSGRVL